MTPVLFAIIACEVGFWVLLLAGLTARYVLRLHRLSTVLLLCVPLIDLALLALIAWDMLVNGTTADFSHGLGAIYLGFTIAFGHQLISRIDGRFAHRFAGGPPPFRAPREGVAQLRYEWGQWGRMVLCASIASLLLIALIVIVGDPQRTAELREWIGRVWAIAAVWLVFWPGWVSVAYVLRSRTAPAALPEHTTPTEKSPPRAE